MPKRGQLQSAIAKTERNLRHENSNFNPPALKIQICLLKITPLPNYEVNKT